MSRRQRTRSAVLQSRYVLVGRPFFGREEIKEVVATLESGWWASGPKTAAFTGQFRQYIGSRYALAVNSCTAGMHIALAAVGVGPGDEVITTPLTFPASASAIIHAGATPVFVDVLPETGNIDPAAVAAAITPKTKAILPVHLYGRPCAMDGLIAIAKQHGLYIIEDAAHCTEGRYHGKKIGAVGDITAFSFYASKNLATGEGGMVTTNNKKWLEKMNLMHFHGLSRNPYQRSVTGQSGGYECVLPGYSYPMTDMQAALGIHQLARLEANLRRRQQYWQMYDESFRDIRALRLPAAEEPDTRHARHLYTVLVQPKELGFSRAYFTQQLWRQRIGTIIHFKPVHLHRYFRQRFRLKRGDFPNAEYIGDHTVSLPLGAGLTKGDIKRVIAAVQTVVRQP